MENTDYVSGWAKNGVIYHIYPFGFFGAPKNGNQEIGVVPRLEYLRGYYPHFEDLGITIIQFGPVFESVSHGYDTTDYFKIDHRLGTNELFRQIVTELHERNIRVIVDGVFNHVGRNFESFLDVKKFGYQSWRKHWHFIDFNENSPYDDGFDYKNWEGHYSLVKLNLKEPDVRNHIFHAVEYWLGDIGIDGWRLDVAYQLPLDFLKAFRKICKQAKPDCLLIGEMIHGPYSQRVGSTLLDAGTGYQVHKSIWSSFNSQNFHEIKAVIEQAFHPQWGLEKNVWLVNFLDNHDVNRIRSQLNESDNMFPAYLLLFTLNGIPKIYYGSEIGLEGMKTETSDDQVRQPMPPDKSHWPDRGDEVYNHVKLCIKLRKEHDALRFGSLIPIYAGAEFLVFMRQSREETLIIVLSSATSTQKCKIPLWNLNLDGKSFTEILPQGGGQHYRVVNNHLIINELYPNWGRILKLI